MNKLLFQISFFVSIFILLTVAFSAYRTFKDFEEDNLWIEHSEWVKVEIERFSNLPRDVSNEIRRAALMKDSLKFSQITKIGQSYEKQYALLDSLVRDNRKQSANVAKLVTLIESYLQRANMLVSQMSSDYDLNPQILEDISKQDELISEITDLARKMLIMENQLLYQRREERKRSRLLAPTALSLLTISALSLIIFLFINIFSLFNKNQVAAKNLKRKVDELNEEALERTRLQHLLTNILNSSTNGIIAFKSIRDQNKKVIDFDFINVNNAACEIVGIPRNKLLGSTMLEQLPGNNDSGLFKDYVKVVESGETLSKTQYYQYDNLNTWFQITAIKNGDGFVVTFIDVNEQKLKEQELMENQEELKATNLELEKFAYIASHDLQEPLRKVRAFGDRLKSLYLKKLDERGLDYINRMQSAAERMQILIDDLLKFSRVSRSEREFKQVDLNAIYDEVIETLDLKIKEKKAKIAKNKLPEILGDYTELSQIFLNLIDNSLKYSKENRVPKIIIHATSNTDEINAANAVGKYWKITFKDNGIGFDPKYKEQIFIIFQRLHSKAEYFGTGIGLAICEKIVLNHGGIIKADSEPNNGSVFTIYFPKI